MTDTLTDEQIEYIRAWAASGNGVRCAALDQVEVSGVQGILPDWAWEMLDEHEDTFCQLSPAGLNIASQAERVRELEAVRDRLVEGHWTPSDSLTTLHEENVNLLGKVLELEAENGTLGAYLSGAVGALTDAGNIPCGEFETVAEGIRQLTAERDKLRKAMEAENARRWELFVAVFRENCPRSNPSVARDMAEESLAIADAALAVYREELLK